MKMFHSRVSVFVVTSTPCCSQDIVGSNFLHHPTRGCSSGTPAFFNIQDRRRDHRGAVETEAMERTAFGRRH